MNRLYLIIFNFTQKLISSSLFCQTTLESIGFRNKIGYES